MLLLHGSGLPAHQYYTRISFFIYVKNLQPPMSLRSSKCTFVTQKLAVIPVTPAWFASPPRKDPAKLTSSMKMFLNRPNSNTAHKIQDSQSMSSSHCHKKHSQVKRRQLKILSCQVNTYASPLHDHKKRNQRNNTGAGQELNQPVKSGNRDLFIFLTYYPLLRFFMMLRGWDASG